MNKGELPRSDHLQCDLYPCRGFVCVPKATPATSAIVRKHRRSFLPASYLHSILLCKGFSIIPVNLRYLKPFPSYKTTYRVKIKKWEMDFKESTVFKHSSQAQFSVYVPKHPVFPFHSPVASVSPSDFAS